MFSSVVNYIKLSVQNIQSRLTLNRRYKFLALLISAICIVLLIYLITHLISGHSGRPVWNDTDFEESFSHLKDGLAEISQQEIVILQWTSFWTHLGPPKILNSDICSVLKTGSYQQPPVSKVFDIPCRITFDHRYLTKSHAVVFHSPDQYYLGYGLPPKPRIQNQIWIWRQMESPQQTVMNLKRYRNVFNWTMTYRRDSDVYFPYASLVPRNITTHTALSSFEPSALDNPLDRKSLEMKTELVAWIVSSCETPSKRGNFGAELQKYIPVDIFGTCGDKSCPELQDKGYFPCYDYIHSKYKFYLSFENSLCDDYITEKFYIALQYNMVPVVYGAGNGEHDCLAVAPENSFIDARKFKSPKDLANYLIYLDNNDDEYLKYFEWKAEYKVIYKDYGDIGLGFCNLCQRVYEQIQTKDPLWNKWYSDLYKWWNFKSFSNENNPFVSQSKFSNNPVGQSFHYSLKKLESSCVVVENNFTSYRK